MFLSSWINNTKVTGYCYLIMNFIVKQTNVENSMKYVLILDNVLKSIPL